MPEKDKLVPAVPAQEAPREFEVRREMDYQDGDVWHFREAEPQAGAQVPSQDEIGSILVAAIDRHITDESLRDLAVIAANGIYWRNQRIGELETHLYSIKSYATEAAKTPITRESILAAPQVDEKPIPDDLKAREIELRSWLKDRTTRMPDHTPLNIELALIQRIARLEEELEARKLTELSQFDEMQGFCRLVLSEIGGGK